MPMPTASMWPMGTPAAPAPPPACSTACVTGYFKQFAGGDAFEDNAFASLVPATEEQASLVAISFPATPAWETWAGLNSAVLPPGAPFIARFDALFTVPGGMNDLFFWEVRETVATGDVGFGFMDHGVWCCIYPKTGVQKCRPHRAVPFLQGKAPTFAATRRKVACLTALAQRSRTCSTALPNRTLQACCKLQPARGRLPIPMLQRAASFTQQ
jgi:hypothetical protein